MIVCSCNVFSDRDVRSALDSAPARPATANQVYGCLGCSPQCGRCARTIRRIMDEALGAAAASCAQGCAVACAHMHAEADPQS
jgi:bacterioferritin-associated ferredoxin